MAHAVPLGLSHIGLPKEFYVAVAVPLGFEMQGQSTKTIWHTLCHWDCQKKFLKRSLCNRRWIVCNCRCAIGIWDTKAFNKAIWHTLCHWDCGKRLSKKVCVIVVVPLRFEIPRLSAKPIWPTLCPWDCQKRLSREVCVIDAVPLGLWKKIVKRSLCNSRCAIGIVKKDCHKKSVQ